MEAWIERQMKERERPEGRPVMFQSWEHLLFLHWAVEPKLLQSTLPPGLTIDTFGEKAWLAVVPFRMSGVRPRGLLAVPWLSRFLELNVRTYVRDETGRPGVWFYSLDCNQPVAVEVARLFFKLDYFHARMRMEGHPEGEGVIYTSWRKDRRSPEHQPAWSRFHYRPTGPDEEAESGSLEFFLVERYRLFSQGAGGSLRSGRVWHPPYRISPARAEDWDIGPAQADGLPLPRGNPDHVCYARHVDVEVFPLDNWGR
jgi:uncharacterized protein YqjF (DUF2071 family)